MRTTRAKSPLWAKLLLAFGVLLLLGSGGTLTLQTSSTATSNNTFTVQSGGTMGSDTGANITGFGGSVDVSGGTFNSQGTIQFSSGGFTAMPVMPDSTAAVPKISTGI